jgi:hypothetical protein
LKRLFVIPLLFVYLTAVSGVLIQLHYCGQELESWTLYSDGEGCEGDACGDETMGEDGCCKDEVVVAKVMDDQNTVTQQFLKFIDIPADLPEYHNECIECIGQYNAGTLQYSPNAPPGLWQNIPLYKLNSSLTYYG